MKFTVDLQTRRLQNYRLQEDGSCRRLENREIAEGDISFSNPYDAQRECDLRRKSKITLDGSEYIINPGVMELRDTTIVFVSPTIHRITKPREFTKNEMRNVIACGDDDRFNALTLDLYGRFQLRDFDENLGLVCDPGIAVRNECFCAGNEYVGPDAAKDKSHITSTYLGMLRGWLTHLRTGELNVFVDYHSDMTEKEMWKEVEKITKHLEEKNL